MSLQFHSLSICAARSRASQSVSPYVNTPSNLRTRLFLKPPPANRRGRVEDLSRMVIYGTDRKVHCEENREKERTFRRIYFHYTVCWKSIKARRFPEPVKVPSARQQSALFFSYNNLFSYWANWVDRPSSMLRSWHKVAAAEPEKERKYFVKESLNGCIVWTDSVA